MIKAPNPAGNKGNASFHAGQLTPARPPTYRDRTMKVLVIGGGGREHALAWGLRKSPSVSKIWCAPGNAGIAQGAECIPADLNNVSSLADLATNLGADLTIVGPEQPLVLGIADEFSRRGLRLLGPSKSCAQLEGSKVFAKQFLGRHAIPTASFYGVYDMARPALDALHNVPWPVVLKADGLCAGKGVLVATSYDEAATFVERVLERREFGEGGARLMMEAALTGPELSLIILIDGQRYAPLVPCRDHKRAFDGDHGPNTGGMGVYSSDDIVSPDLYAKIIRTIVQPTMAGLAADGESYRGFLYFGLMLTPSGPSVLEFNCRLGDPETQAIIPRADFDLAEVFSSAAEGNLAVEKVKWKPGASVCVVMASGGYPGKFEVGKRIDGLAQAAATPDVAVFHAGTKAIENVYYTNSGRVLGVSATGSNLSRARETVYDAVRRIQFAGAHYRTDIAASAGRASEVARG